MIEQQVLDFIDGLKQEAQTVLDMDENEFPNELDYVFDVAKANSIIAEADATTLMINNAENLKEVLFKIKSNSESALKDLTQNRSQLKEHMREKRGEISGKISFKTRMTRFIVDELDIEDVRKRIKTTI